MLFSAAGISRCRKIEKPIANAKPNKSKTTKKTNFGQRTALIVCFHLFPRLSFSGCARKTQTRKKMEANNQRRALAEVGLFGCFAFVRLGIGNWFFDLSAPGDPGCRKKHCRTAI